ncbi:MAG: uncharacterized protein A8A55_0258 [Amphiamblys sp. WSBS2006]|nr:MAG: uncharacterized protein A8A55_0258 [Amphiamblys sp. WSBS2006]
MKKKTDKALPVLQVNILLYKLDELAQTQFERFATIMKANTEIEAKIPGEKGYTTNTVNVGFTTRERISYTRPSKTTFGAIGIGVDGCGIKTRGDIFTKIFLLGTDKSKKHGEGVSVVADVSGIGETLSQFVGELYRHVSSHKFVSSFSNEASLSFGEDRREVFEKKLSSEILLLFGFGEEAYAQLKKLGAEARKTESRRVAAEIEELECIARYVRAKHTAIEKQEKRTEQFLKDWRERIFRYSELSDSESFFDGMLEFCRVQRAYGDIAAVARELTQLYEITERKTGCLLSQKVLQICSMFREINMERKAGEILFHLSLRTSSTAPGSLLDTGLFGIGRASGWSDVKRGIVMELFDRFTHRERTSISADTHSLFLYLLCEIKSPAETEKKLRGRIEENFVFGGRTVAVKPHMCFLQVFLDEKEFDGRPVAVRKIEKNRKKDFLYSPSERDEGGEKIYPIDEDISVPVVLRNGYSFPTGAVFRRTSNTGIQLVEKEVQLSERSELRTEVRIRGTREGVFEIESIEVEVFGVVFLYRMKIRGVFVRRLPLLCVSMTNARCDTVVLFYGQQLELKILLENISGERQTFLTVDMAERKNAVFKARERDNSVLLSTELGDETKDGVVRVSYGVETGEVVFLRELSYAFCVARQSAVEVGDVNVVFVSHGKIKIYFSLENKLDTVLDGKIATGTEAVAVCLSGRQKETFHFSVDETGLCELEGVLAGAVFGWSLGWCFGEIKIIEKEQVEAIVEKTRLFFSCLFTVGVETERKVCAVEERASVWMEFHSKAEEEQEINVKIEIEQEEEQAEAEGFILCGSARYSFSLGTYSKRQIVFYLLSSSVYLIRVTVWDRKETERVFLIEVCCGL